MFCKRCISAERSIDNIVSRVRIYVFNKEITLAKSTNNKETLSNQSEPFNESLRLKTSVRNLVAFSVKDDALWSFTSYRLANEGSLAHSQLQAINRAKGNYVSEVHLSHSFEIMGCILE